MFVSKTCTIHDWNLVDAMTSNSNHWTIGSTISTSYSSNGASFNGSSWSNNRITLDTSIAPSHIIEYDIGSITSTIYFKLIGSTTLEWYIQANGQANFNGTSYSEKGGTGHYAFKVYSDKVEFYKDNTLVATANITLGSSSEFVIDVGSGCKVTIKDVLIKPL